MHIRRVDPDRMGNHSVNMLNLVCHLLSFLADLPAIIALLSVPYALIRAINRA